MVFKHPFRRLSLILGVCGLLLSGIFVLGNGTAHALPNPQAVEDATLVVIVRPDDKVPDGYRIEEILSDTKQINHIGDLLVLPNLKLESPSEDSEEAKANATPKPGDEPEQGVGDAEDDTPKPPKDAFPEAPILPSPVYKWPKPENKKDKSNKKSNKAANPTPTPAPNPFPEAPPLAPSEAPPVSPTNPFPEAPLEAVPVVPPPLLPGTPPNGTPSGAPNGVPNGAPLAPPTTEPPLVAPPNGEVQPLSPVPVPLPEVVPTPMPVPHDPTLDRRILVYLWNAPDDAGRYSVTQGGEAYAWVADSGHTEVLRQQGVVALNALRDWQAALTVTEPKAQIAALWPFLGGYERRYNTLAQLQLDALGTPAGDYIAAHWKETDAETRMTLLPTLASYRSETLHQALVAHLKGLQRQYEVYLAMQEHPSREQADAWNDLPEKMKTLYGETYYGLVGLTAFKDRRDLPYIRTLATWALKYRFKQTDDAALDAFKTMPAEDNLLVISDIWREYSTRPIPGNELQPREVINALTAHRIPASVPQLAVFLRHPDPAVVTLARTSMRRIVGRDLGNNPMAWVSWARAQKKSGEASQVVKPAVGKAEEKTAGKARATVKSARKKARRN